MTAVWIALGAVAISLMTVFISLGAAKEAKRKKEGDGGSTYASDTGDRDRTDSDSESGGDSGGDGGGGD